MNPLRKKLTLAGACVAAALSVSLAVPAYAQSNDAQKQAGEAVVRQRNGPSVEVKPGQSARVVVLFPGAGNSSSTPYAQQQQQQGLIQVVAVKGPPQQQNGERQQQPGQQQPESEIIFAKDQAINGLVVFGGDENARRGNTNGSSLTFMAEMGGKALKVDQASGGQDGRVYVMTAKLDPQQVQKMMQQDQQGGQPGQQAQTAGGEEMTAEQRQEQQKQQQEQQQKRQQEMQKMQDQVHAVILVYLEGEPTEQEAQ